MSLVLTDKLLRLFAAGGLVAAPFGPVSFFVFRCTLHNRFGVALMAGLGAAAADAILGFSAFLGVQGVHLFFETYQRECRLAGGLFSVFLGLFLLFTSPNSKKVDSFKERPLMAFGTGFLITILNPLTLTGFVFAFSLLKLTGKGGDFHPVLTAVFVFCGAFCWWLTLAALGRWGGSWLSVSKITKFNKLMSVLLMGFGLFLLGAAGFPDMALKK